ncbi:MAG: hypothetical protein QOJ89_2634 [bacterium]|jgi:hypothetical protein
MSEPADEPQDEAQAMRSDMSDRAFADSGEVVRSVQVPRDGGDNADATATGAAAPDPDAESSTDSD